MSRLESALSTARRLAAGGRLTRVAVCAVVVLAAVVWVAAAAAVLRLLLIAALLGIGAWCVWLVRAVWRQEDAGPVPVRVAALWLHARVVLARWIAPAAADAAGAGEDGLERLERVLDEQRAALLSLRRSVDALGRDARARPDGGVETSERLTRDLAAGVEAMRSLLAQVERDLVAAAARHAPAPAAPAGDAESDFHDVYRDLEADFRLEAIEAREQSLAELEDRLRRREAELATFVAQAQGRLD